MKYKAICFDIDGTLYPPAELTKRFGKVIARHPLYMKRYDSMRRHIRRDQAGFQKDIPLRDRETEVYYVGVTSENVAVQLKDDPNFLKAKERLERIMYRPLAKAYTTIQPWEGTRDTLTRLKDHGLKLGAFTDWPLGQKLERLGLSDLFDVATDSDEVGFLKPDPHCLEYLLYNLKLEPSEVLYVGDSYVKDVAGARAAGVDGVLINANDVGKDLPLALKVFADWKGFDAWISELLEEN